MLYRPLILVFALVAGDYAIWTWSVGDSHDVVALISGFALAPLSIAFVWLLARSGLRVLGRAARAPGRPRAATAADPTGTRARRRMLRRRRRSAKMLRTGSEDPAQAASGSTSSSAKIAA